MSNVPYFIGLDIGGTNMKAVAVTAGGITLAESRVPTEDGDRPAWGERLKPLLDAWTAEHGAASAIGVAAPGLAARDRRSIAWMQGRMAAVQDLVWSDELGLDQFVPVLNDGQAALLGEAWLGAARGSENVVMLTLGTGVGGAALVDGRILRGAIGRAGHLGHISLDPFGPPDIVGTPGSLEDAIGQSTVLERSGGRFETTHELVEAAANDDLDAKEIWLTSVAALAAGIVSLINAFDPEVVVLGGGISAAKEALLQPLLPMLDTFEWRPHGHKVRLEFATLGDRAGALGAARYGMIERS
jgi:glucokinase